ncbi:MAG: ribosome biogenesis GTPase YlqF [Oscillospiraceae bacterium]|nr:ribosome biogenesis GTPase YlqF [Oscillospiraceae bacterium]
MSLDRNSAKREAPPQVVQWFPGHMAKTRRLMKESLPLIDAVVELRDARAPESSRNPELGELIGQKPRLVLLNKADLADADTTARWLKILRKEHAAALAVDCRSGRGLQAFSPAVKAACVATIEKNAARGMANRPIRLMIAGIPNVGKSSLINRLAGQNRAKVADQPGVTRRNQWHVAGKIDGITIELLDTPGVLWPKFDDPAVGETLAFLGSVKDAVIDSETLALRLITVLATGYPQLLQRYKLDDISLPAWQLLEEIARKRGMLLRGNEPDTERASIMLLDELRGGRLGRLTFDLPASNT